MFAEKGSGGQVECWWESTCAALIARFASDMEEVEVNDLGSWAAVDFAFHFAVFLVITLGIKC